MRMQFDPGLVSLMVWRLGRSSRDKEPLVDAWVDWSRSNVLALGDGWELLLGDTAWRLGNGEVGTVDAVREDMDTRIR